MGKLGGWNATLPLDYCAYHTDYHWDCHLYFVIIPFMHRLYSYLLTCLTPYMTHTTTDTSSIWTMTQSYYPTTVTLVAFLVLVLIVFAWQFVVYNLYH
jgi:hypothetical protein